MIPPKYQKSDKVYNILGLAVTAKPFKLRYKLLSGNITYRIHQFCMRESGLTVEESSDASYTSLLQLYEKMFFSLGYDPNEEILKEKQLEIKKIKLAKAAKSAKENKIKALDEIYKYQPTGKENLIELLTICVKEEIDWKKFIDDKISKLKGNNQFEVYNQIREAAMQMYVDFFIEVIRLKTM